MSNCNFLRGKTHYVVLPYCYFYKIILPPNNSSQILSAVLQRILKFGISIKAQINDEAIFTHSIF